MAQSQPLPEIVDREQIAVARAGLPSMQVVRDAADVFKILANPVRIRIMHALAHGELSVGDLARALDLSMSAVSHQLTLLRRMRLIAARSEGRLVFHHVTDAVVGDLVHDGLVHAGAHLATPREAHSHPHRAERRRAAPARKSSVGRRVRP